VKGSLTVNRGNGGSGYEVSYDPKAQFAQQGQFAEMQVAMLDANHAGLALAAGMRVDAQRLGIPWPAIAL
jgi:hypothetical protein